MKFSLYLFRGGR